jgi:hypothetical protein
VKVFVFRKALVEKTELLQQKISKLGPQKGGPVLHLEYELVATVVAQAVMNPSEQPVW